MSAKEMAERLAREELPLLKANIRQILASTNDETRSLAEIGEFVSRDPALTAQVLRLANSVMYSTGRAPLNSLPRVLMILGLGQVRALCFSAMVLESTVAASYQERVFTLLRRSLELAGQARFLAEKFRVDPEPYFLAGLLSQIGRIAFWCAGGAEADSLHQALHDGYEENEAEQKILGYTLSQVDHSLLAQWGLSSLRQLPNCAGIRLVPQAKLLIELMRDDDTSALEKELLRLQPLFQQAPRELLRALRENRERSLAVLPRDFLHDPALGSNQIVGSVSLQMRVLADMHALPKSGSYLSSLVQMAVNGLWRAANWDQAVFAILTAQGWREKFRAGSDQDAAKPWALDAIVPDDLLSSGWKRVEICDENGAKVLRLGQTGAAGLLTLLGRPSGLLLVASNTAEPKDLEPQFLAFERFYRQLVKMLSTLD